MIEVDDRELKQVINQLRYFDTQYFNKDLYQSAKKAGGTIMTKWAKDANARINFPFTGGHEKSGSFTLSMRRYSQKDKSISKSKYKYKKTPIKDKGNGQFDFRLKIKLA